MSRQSTATDTLPQEIWLRIFALVDSTKSLGCVVLVCHKFHILGTEALVRHVGWRSSTVAIHHMEFWDRNPSKTHLVRSVSLSLAGCDNENDDFRRIFGCIQSFSRLKHIKLSFGAVPDVLYSTLQSLPSVTHLSLKCCAIPYPPLFFPYSYPSPLLRPYHVANFLLDTVTVPIAYHLPNLRSYVTDSIGIQIPTEASAQLSSLTLALTGVMGDIQPRLDLLLHRMPALTHLDVSIATNGHQAPQGTASTVSPQPSPPLPALRTLSVPWPAAGHILAGAPALAHLRVTSPIIKPTDAVWLLERLRATPLRTAALRLHVWDDEVLLAAVRCLPACEVLEIVYKDGGPSEGFVFDLGIQHLPLLRALHTLRIFALPPVVDTTPLRFEEDDEEDGEDEVEREKTAALRECVHAWARYNPTLTRVQLGCEEKRTWVRRAVGGGWDTDEEDEERRAEAWARTCAAG
ncbi:hypothetical protein B0H13DRAFT_1983062 [Mycena leptocephala]|nr:hypothetical protein B0H13DRAFT_1983062 [Mycena leptocephala]